jgi:hypothetical protein
MDKGTIDAFVDDRYSLNPDIIEADLCLKNWFNNGIADGRAAFAIRSFPGVGHIPPSGTPPQL